MSFDISGIVRDVGEAFTISGVARTYNEWGDPVETYSAYNCSGVVQVMDGSEDEVREGILSRQDVVLFVDEDAVNAQQLKNEAHVTVSQSTSGVFRVVGVVHNLGHFEIQAKRILSL